MKWLWYLQLTQSELELLEMILGDAEEAGIPEQPDMKEFIIIRDKVSEAVTKGERS